MVKDDARVGDGISGHGQLCLFGHFSQESLRGSSHRYRECGFFLDLTKVMHGISLPGWQIPLLSPMLRGQCHGSSCAHSGQTIVPILESLGGSGEFLFDLFRPIHECGYVVRLVYRSRRVAIR